MKLQTILAACLLGLLLSDITAAAPIEMRLTEHSMIWDYAPHNAFPDMVRYQDQWYVAFREGTSHAVAGDGLMRVIRSSDAENWESVALLDWNAEYEMRDARLTVLADGRLMLNGAGAPLASTYERQSLCWFTDNGNDWSPTPFLAGEKDWWLWSVAEHPSGDLYGIAYGKLGINPDPVTTTRLYRSEDGIDYQTHVSTLTSHSNTNEADLIFLQDGTAVTLVRQNSSGQCVVGTSTGDYTDWNFQTINKSIGGPELIELPDGNIVAATRLYDGTVRTALSWLDPATGQMEELLTLPSGGDTSYPGLVWHEDRLWVTYYSSHEGKSNIYLSQVEVSAATPKPIGLVCRHEGSADPTTEGWTLFGGGGGITEEPVTNDPIGGLDGDQRLTLTGLGDGYHLYELIYDPDAASADLFVDGIEMLSDYTGSANIGLARVMWGANQSGSVGSGNYNDASHVYFMFPSLFQHGPDTLDIRLAVSRDGIKWTWPQQDVAFIPLGKEGSFDSKCLYMGQGILQVGDETWLYYSGAPLTHSGHELDDLIKCKQPRAFSRVVMQRDRFVSADAGPKGGWFVTPPLTFYGDTLVLNANVRDGGSIRVALLDEKGKPLPGRGLDDCLPITGDHLVAAVKWKAGGDVALRAGQPTRMKVELKNASLFSFQFTTGDVVK